MSNWVPLDAFHRDELEEALVKATLETPPEHCEQGYKSCVDILVEMLELHLKYIQYAEKIVDKNHDLETLTYDPHGNEIYYDLKLHYCWFVFTRCICDREGLKMMDDEDLQERMDQEGVEMIESDDD